MSLSTKTLALLGVGAVTAALGGHALLDKGPSADQVRVVAYFTDSSPLLPGNVVKASGVDVGTITDITLDHGKARVTMNVDRSALPLHRDVRATITTQDLLGERFVKLDRGSDSSPALPAPYVISTEHTARVVDLQDVLNSVDTPTATALSALLTETGEGVRGQGKQAGEAIAALKPAMTQARDLASILADQNALLTRLVDNTQPVAAALAADDGRQLDQLVRSATRSLETVAAERTALQTSLRELPGTIAHSRTALADLAGVARPATRTLASVRPVTDDLKDISGELQRFSDAADPALASLPPVLAQADRLLAQAAPVVRALKPATRDLVPNAAAARQLSDVALSGRSLTNLMEFVKGWSMATSDYDAISHYFKAMVPLSPASLGDTAAGLLPALPDNVLHGLPVPTAPTLPLPPRTPVPPKNPLKNLLGGLLGGLSGQGTASQGTATQGTAGRDSATGLSQDQESSLLGQLLGGL